MSVVGVRLFSALASTLVFLCSVPTSALQGKPQAAASLATRGEKLNAPLEPRVTSGDVSSFRASPDGTWLVFRADAEQDERFELFALSAAGGPAVKLNGVLVPGGDVAPDFGYTVQPNYAVSPDSTRVVYAADQDVDERFELYSTPIDGGIAVRLNAPFASETLATFAIAPDSSRVVYRTSEAAPHLWSVPIGGGLALDLGTGGEFAISPDASHVVFLDTARSGLQELYRAPLVGGGATKLNPALVSGGAVLDLRIAPDGSRVIYRAEQDVDGVVELYSVPFVGGASTKISGTLAGVLDFTCSPDGARVVFRAPSAGATTLFSVLAAGGLPTSLTGPLTPGGNVSHDYAINTASTHVVFRADALSDEVTELFSAPIGGAPSTRLNLPLTATQDVVSYRATPNGARVLFKVLDSTVNRITLHSVPVAGGVALNIGGTLAHDGLPPSFTPDSGRALVSIWTPTTQDEYVVPVGGGPLVNLTGTRTPGSFVSARQIVGNTHCVLLSNTTDPDSVWMHAVPLTGGTLTRLGAPLASTSTGDVIAVALAPDARNAVYVADQDEEGIFELYRASVPGGAVAKLTPPPAGQGLDTTVLVTPDGTRVLYRSEQDTAGRRELYSVALSGGPSIKLNAPVSDGVFNPVLSPDSLRVVYEADQGIAGQFGLHSVPVTGGASTALSGGLVNPSQATIAPDSQRVLFIAQGPTSFQELYSVPLVGGPPTRLNPNIVAGGAVDRFGFSISPDSTHVVYTADQEVNNRVELYSVPIAGGSALKLNGPIPSGGTLVSASATIGANGLVVFRGAQATNKVELHAVPITGGTPLRLNASLPAAGAVTDYRLSPDGTRVAYVADASVDERFEVFSVSTAGGAVTPLSGPVVVGSTTRLQAMNSDSRRIVYTAERAAAGMTELLASELAGGTTVLTTLPAGRTFTHVLITPDARTVLFRADAAADERYELYAVPIRGGRPVRLNAELVSGGDALDPNGNSFDASKKLAVTSNAILYLADQDEDDTFELFASYLIGPIR